MGAAREEHRVGLDYLEAVTALLQRVRSAHPTKGLYEAADVQWWWRTPRSSDGLPQLVWFDDDARPEAASIIIDWGDWFSLVPIVMPDAAPEWVAEVVGRGLAHAAGNGIDAVELEVDRSDEALRGELTRRGFEAREEGFVVEAWLPADARPEISPLHDGYRLVRRADSMSLPHHMISKNRNHDDVEPRLRQTSLYRADLDLAVYDSNDEPAGYGLFWHDPVTATGLVEPMRTEDEHQQRGLARHILTAGVNLLAEAGAARIKICFETDNPASSHLYRSVGFEPVKQTDLFAGPTNA